MESDRRTRGRDVDLTSFLAYNLIAVPIALAGLALARFSSEKLRAGVEGRRELFARLEAQRDELSGCVWFHASSAGEYEQGRPILRSLRKGIEARGEHIPTLVTAFSPSGHAHASQHPESDVTEFLPLDTPSNARRMMRLLRPRVLVFVKFDCWPNMVWAARREGIPIVLLDATFHSRSQRQLPIARKFFGRLFDCFDRIGAIGEADRARFRSIGAQGEIVITGDTRTDQVIHRYEQADEGALQRALNAQDYRYLALGSIWPADQKVILEPMLDRLDQDPTLGLIAVPHEPTPAHLKSIEAAMRAHGLTPSRLSELVEPRSHARRSTAAAKDPARWRAIVVDTVGALAEIYRATILSYVGGSFTTGVHNTLEPAIVGQPVLFGPRIQNAHEAELLVERGGAFVVETRETATSTLRDLLENEERRQAVGAIAANFVLSQRGATQASVELLDPYVFDR